MGAGRRTRAGGAGARAGIALERAPRTHRLAPALLVAGLALMSMAWVFANPPGAAPDEPAHYVKTVGLAHGTLLGRELRPGERADWESDTWFRRHSEPVAAQRRDWFRRITRVVRIPARLAPVPGAFGCNSFLPERSAACVERGAPVRDGTARPPDGVTPNVSGDVDVATYLGTRQPYVLLPVAPLARLATTPEAALTLGRVGIAVLSVGMIGMAAFLLWDSRTGAISLLGLQLAVTPMVIFTASTLTASGPEIAAGILLFALLLRLRRGDAPPRPSAVAAGLGGVVLAIARPIGPLLVAALVVAGLAIAGLGRARVLVASRGRPALVIGGLVVGAAVANLWWQLAFQPHATVSQAGFWRFAREGFGDVPSVLRQAIGVFGWTDTPLPPWIYGAWLALVGALLLVALVRGTAGQRGALIVTLLGGLGLVVVVRAAFAGPFDVDIQGRWVLPFLAGVPMLAADVAFRCLGDGRRVRAAAAFSVAVLALVHLLAFCVNARRHAVGTAGPLGFLRTSAWEPPGGWAVWFALAATGAVLFALSSTLASRAASGAPVANDFEEIGSVAGEAASRHE